MKVVKNGRIINPKNWKTKVKCGKKDEFDKKGCGAVMLITAEDLVMMYWRGTHFSHYYIGVRCPWCGKYNRVKNVPNQIWEEFNTSKNRKKAVSGGFSEAI